jgi:hypothetical protein
MEIFLEPRDRTIIYVAHILGLANCMPLVRVDDKRGRNSQLFERVPKLHRPFGRAPEHFATRDQGLPQM